MVYMANLSDCLNFTNQTFNNSVPAVYVLDPTSQVQTLLLAIIAFCSLFQVCTKIYNWVMSDVDD